MRLPVLAMGPAGGRVAWPALLAGGTGGLAAGLYDAAWLAASGAGVLADPRTALLVALEMGTGGVAGLLMALILTGGTAAARRALGAARAGALHADVPLAAAVLAAPLACYDALAMFRGARASRIPGHWALSGLLAIGAIVAVFGLAWACRRLVARAQAGGARRPALAAACVAAVAAVGLHAANRLVLPRLYPWFHASLTVLYLVLGVVAARLLLAARPGPAAESARGQRRRALLVAAAATLLAVLAAPSVVRSQSLRFAAFERTQVAAFLLRGLPLSVLRTPARGGAGPRDRTVASLPEGPRAPDADVFLITVDALRADHVGAYGYRRATTPNIDALAARGVRFERAYAQAPHTSFSVASMLTGKYYPTLARLAPGDLHDPISDTLRRYGWKTAAFYPPSVFFVDAQKLRAYQDDHFRFEYVKYEYLDAHARLRQIEEFFRADRPDRAFVWLHLFEPHEPYDARTGFAFGPRDLDRYDSEVAYTDAAVGKVLEFIARERPGAVVILTADHGEEFDDHGGRYHGSSLHDEQVRVPLIIAGPGIAPHVVAGPVELVDLAPTILAILDIPVPVRMRGTDLGPWLAHPSAGSDLLPPAFAEFEDDRMVVWRSEKLICKMNWAYCTLYDLAADPGELRNLAEDRADRTAALRGKLDEWLDDHVRFEPQIQRGTANPGGEDVPKAIERGRLGDVRAAEALAEVVLSGEGLPVRREAARLLATLPPRRETLARVAPALAGERDPEVRDWMAIAAARLGEVAAATRLRALLARPGKDGWVWGLRVRAALGLANLSDATGVPELIAALAGCKDDVPLCRLVVIALGNLRDGRAVPPLIAQLGQVQNRRETVEALGRIGDPRATAPLIDRLRRDEYVPVRAQAAGALAALGGPEALAALDDALAREPEAAVRDAVKRALGGLRPAAGAPQSPPPARRGTAHSRPPAAPR